MDEVVQVGDLILYKGGSWPPPIIPYEDGEEEVWEILCRGYGPIPPKESKREE